MNIVVLRSNPVDPDSRVEKEVNALLKDGHNVRILAWDRSLKYRIKESILALENGNVKIYRFGIPAAFGGGIKKNLLPLAKFQLKLYIWLYKNREKYDIIHSCDFDTAYTASKISKKLNKKLVYDIFDFYVDSFNVPYCLRNYIKKQDYKIINLSDATIICSEKRKEQIIGSSPQKLLVIHNTPSEFCINTKLENLNLNSSKIKIAYIGILANGRLIKEIAEIVKKNPSYEFHIGGFGELENYFKEMSKNFSNIFFYGKLPYKKTLELENSCDILSAIYDPTIPNHYYAAPNKFYEALMLGKPVIMAKNTGMDEIVSQNNVGEVINYNMEDLEVAIDRLVERRKDWPDISKKMKLIYHNNYNWTKMEKKLISLYRNLQ